MVNILVNDTNFDANWAYPSLNRYFTKDSKVVVVPFMHSDEYSSDEEEWDYYFKREERSMKRSLHLLKTMESKKRILHSFICLKIPVLH